MRFGIIGFQHLHIDLVLNGLKDCADMQLVALAEADPALRAQWGSRLGVPAYADWTQLIEQERIEAVAVVAAYADRATITAACLRQGIHVICDKPVAISDAQLDELEATISSSSAQFSCLLEKRFWGSYQLLKQLVEEGRLGQIVSAVATGPHKLLPATRPQWMFDRATYGGTIVDLTVHDIDALLWLCGGSLVNMRAVHSQRRWREAGDLEDTAQLFFQTDRGLTAFIDVNWLTPTAAPWHGDYRLLLNGTHGSATISYVDGALRVATDGEGLLSLPLPADGNPFTDWAQAIASGTRSSIDPHDIIRATRYSLLARRSADLGKELTIDSFGTVIDKV